MLIGLIGAERAGKDTLANSLVKNHKFKRFAFGDALKEEVWQKLQKKSLPNLGKVFTKNSVGGKKGLGWTGKNWTGPKSEEGRKVLQLYGNYAREHISPTYWCDKVIKNCRKYKNTVITDARYGNEINAILNKNGCIVHVKRKEADRLHTKNYYNKKYTEYPACEIEWRLFLTLYNFDKNVWMKGIGNRFNIFTNFTNKNISDQLDYDWGVFCLYETIQKDYENLPQFNLDKYVANDYSIT